jgi:hypothetical protein
MIEIEFLHGMCFEYVRVQAIIAICGAIIKHSKGYIAAAETDSSHHKTACLALLKDLT